MEIQETTLTETEESEITKKTQTIIRDFFKKYNYRIDKCWYLELPKNTDQINISDKIFQAAGIEIIINKELETIEVIILKENFHNQAIELTKKIITQIKMVTIITKKIDPDNTRSAIIFYPINDKKLIEKAKKISEERNIPIYP